MDPVDPDKDPQHWYFYVDLEFGGVTDCSLYAVLCLRFGVGLLETIGAGVNGRVEVKIRALSNELRHCLILQL